jgi:hypothetical protein
MTAPEPVQGGPAACLLKIRFRFTGSGCFALYQVTKAEAGPETVDLKVACKICSAPFPARGRAVRPEVFSLARSEPHGCTAGAARFSSGKTHGAEQEAVDEKAPTVKAGASHSERNARVSGPRAARSYAGPPSGAIRATGRLI